MQMQNAAQAGLQAGQADGQAAAKAATAKAKAERQYRDEINRTRSQAQEAGQGLRYATVGNVL